jgi:hypothetical protein
MKLPVPVKGSRMWTPESERDLPNSAWRISSTLRTMKSTMGCGV